MVTKEIILSILGQLKNTDANTSLALIGCILKGDKNSICDAFQNYDEFGLLDEKGMKNMGIIFDDLIDNQFIKVISSGPFKKYEISQKGLDYISKSDIRAEEKQYFESTGSPTDILEETSQLSNTIEVIDNEVVNIKKNKMFDVGQYDVGIDYDDIIDLKHKKVANQIFENNINELKKIKQKPYFGRMDFLESSKKGIQNKQYYIGHQPLNIDNNLLVMNWKSEFAEYYYNKKTKFEYNKTKYELQLNRSIDIDNTILKKVHNNLTRKKSDLKDTISDPFLISVLKNKQDKEFFTDIISTIQEKQNEIIRLPLKSNVIVQGCAGSGKTMILLHRLSYLLYNNKNLKPESIKIITPSELFDRFVNDLSNELELDQVDRLTMIHFYQKNINQHYSLKEASKLRPEREIGKDMLEIIYSQAFLDSMETNLRSLMQNDLESFVVLKKAEIEEKYKAYIVLKNEIDSLINGTLETELVKMKSFFDFSDHLLNYLTYENIKLLENEIDSMINHNKKNQNYLDNQEKSLELLNYKLKTVQEIMSNKFIDDLVDISKSHKFKLFSNNKVSIDVYTKNYRSKIENDIQREIDILIKFIAKIKDSMLPKDQIKKLSSAKNYLVQTVYPIIQQIEEKLSALKDEDSDMMYKYEREYTSFEKNMKDLYAYIEDYGMNRAYINELISQMIVNFKDSQFPSFDFNDYFEITVIGEINTLFKDNNIKVRFHNQYKYYYYLKLALMHKLGFEFDELSLVMIDEAQEYTTSEINLISKIYSKAFINLYGDINQLTSEIGLVNWDNLKDKFDFYELNENYRNPKPIVEYINESLEMEMVPLGLDEGSVQESLQPKDLRIDAIIYFNEDLNEFVRQNKIDLNKFNKEKILHIDETKGLEFNTVLVYSHNMNNNHKYIAYSRSLENLYII